MHRTKLCRRSSCTKYLLYALSSFYTRNLWHQMQFTPEAFCTQQILHQKPFALKNFKLKNLLCFSQRTTFRTLPLFCSIWACSSFCFPGSLGLVFHCDPNGFTLKLRSGSTNGKMIMNSCEDTKFITYRSTHPLSTHWSLGSSYSSESVSSSSVSCPLPHRLKAAISCSYDRLYAISKVNLYMCKIKMISASDCLMTSPAWHWYHLQFPGGAGVAQGTKGRKRTFGTFFGPQLQWDNCGTWWGTSDFHFFSILFGHLGWQPNQNASRHLMTKIIEIPSQRYKPAWF